MRPDEHKKKKNTLYKKKHGIQTDKSKGPKPDDESKRGLKREKTGAAASSSHSHRPSDDADRTHARSYPSSSDSEEHDEQSVGVEYERKSFRRRQITSNWARYDIPTADEEETQAAASRGENFEKLLTKAGGAQSHLTLRDERDWEVGTGEGEARPPCLALELGDLAACLQCLPLHHRLRISHSLFSEEQLKEMEEEAKQKTEGYTKTTRHTTSSMTLLEAAKEVNDSSESGTSSKTSITSVASVKQRDLSLTSVLIKQQNTKVASGKGLTPRTDSDKVSGGENAAVTAPSVPASRSASSALSEESVRSNGAASSSVGEGGASVVTTELEEELDELLALDTPQSQPKPHPTPPGQGDKKEVNPPIVNTPESSGTDPTSTVESDLAAKMSSSMTGKEENLEDWLDSVLGD